MKRWLALFLICSMILQSIASFAATTETKTFDYTVLEKYPGYNYDKFYKSWVYIGSYSKKFAEAIINVGINLSDDKASGTLSPFLFVQAINASGKSVYVPTDIAFLVDDKVYTYSNLFESGNQYGVFLGNIGKQMIEDIANARKISIEITFSIGALPLDPTMEELLEFITICKNLVKHNIWDYVGDNFETNFDTYFEACRL